MRLLLIAPVPPELGSGNRGGVARHAWELAGRLTDSGHEVDLLAVGRYAHPTRTVGGVRVVGPSVSPAALLRAVRAYRMCPISRDAWTVRDRLYLLYTFYRLACLEDPEDYRVVHVHGTSSKAAVAWKALGYGPPVVLTVHSYSEIHFAASREREKAVDHRTDIYGSVDYLVHVSATDRSKGRHYGVKWGSRDRIIHNAVELSSPERPRSHDRSGVCFIGALSHGKGLRELLDAWVHVSTDLTGPLLIAGDGPLASSARDVAERADSVQYLGYIDRPGVRRLLSRTWALVVPSRSESFGLVYVEALLMGAAALGYHATIDELREVLACSAEESDLLRPVDVDRLAAAELAEVIHETVRVRRRDGADRLMARLADRAAARFSWDRAVDELLAVYRAAGGGR